MSFYNQRLKTLVSVLRSTIVLMQEDPDIGATVACTGNTLQGSRSKEWQNFAGERRKVYICLLYWTPGPK